MNWWERIGTVVSLVGALLGGWVYVTSNFASAADLERLQRSVNTSMQSIRVKSLEDKIFELNFKQGQNPKAFSALDNALLQRYKQELQDARKGVTD